MSLKRDFQLLGIAYYDRSNRSVMKKAITNSLNVRSR
jgi:hypothetical protein